MLQVSILLAKARLCGYSHIEEQPLFAEIRSLAIFASLLARDNIKPNYRHRAIHMTKPILVLIMMGSLLAFGAQAPAIETNPPVAAAAPAQTGNLRVILRNFKSDNGQTNVILYNNAYTFPDKPDKCFSNLWTHIGKGYAEVIFKNVPYGDYALAAYHDENSNHRLDLSVIGIPKEGIAISNDAKGLFLPRWKDAKIVVNSPDKTIVMTISY